MLGASAIALFAIVPVVGVKIGGSDQAKLLDSQVATVTSSSDLPAGEVREYEVKSGDTFADVMGAMGVPHDEALIIMNSSKTVFDFTKINAGKLLKFVFVNQAFAAMEYPLNSDTVIHVKKQDDSFEATEENIPYDIQVVTVNGIITDSLFLAAQEAGVEDKVTLKLADMFSGDIDFTTDIEHGDSFSIVYEKRTRDGKPAGAGKVLAAKFINSGKTYNAFRYGDKFYNDNAELLTRQFLRSPLKYANISSGFSYKRTNPVTKQVTPHRAIDYAASEGTPVIATADGVVTIAGSKGGLGITVELKHGNYLTQYAHLSGIAKDIRPGSEVSQGDVVGYVGSTGISTGPHLQYAMFINNSPINPLETNFSRSSSAADFDKETFQKIKSQFEIQLR